MTADPIDLRDALQSTHTSAVSDSLASRLAAAGAGPEASDPVRELRERIHTDLLDRIASQVDEGIAGEAELEQRVRGALPEMIATSQVPLTADQQLQLIELMVDDVIGLGPLEPLLANDDLTEIMVNRFDHIYVADRKGVHLTDVTFASEAHLRRVIDRIVAGVGRRIDEQSPRVDARLEDGSRINATIPPIAIDGANLTIRKFSKKMLTAAELISFGSFTEDAATFLDAAVKGRLNIIVAGSTDSGKTTTLNMLSGFIQEDHRLITIEDIAELRLQQEHVIRLETRPPSIEGTGEITMQELVKNSLRMRPTRIIAGEVRDGAAMDMLEAMSTGHEGSLSTLHANSARDVIDRLCRMVLMAGTRLEVPVIREQIASSVDLIIFQKRMRDFSKKVITITEITGMEGDKVTMQDIFHRNKAGELVAAGVIPHKLDRMADEGIEVPRSLFAADEYTRRLLLQQQELGGAR